MSIQYTFPFCIISNSGTIEPVSGSIAVTEVTTQTSKLITFSTVAKTWENQIPDLQLVLEMPDNILHDSIVEFNITTNLDSESVVSLLFQPQLTHDQLFETHLMPVKQQIVGTDFLHNMVWTRIPLASQQLAQVSMRVHVAETEDTVVELNEVEQYLGKDHLKNLYFNATIPPAWQIPARIQNINDMHNQTVVGFFDGDTVSYQYNNIGYRDIVDYNIEDLLQKEIILCLGDSDTFGIGVDYNNIWPCLVQQSTGKVILNLSIPGISNDGLTRIGVQTIQALSNNITDVLIHYPSMSLREFVSKKYKGGVHTHRNYNLPYADWWDHIDWQSNNYNFNKNKILLESICARYNIKYCDLYINRTDTKIPLDFIGYGVYSSFGPITHRAIANYFLNSIA